MSTKKRKADRRRQGVALVMVMTVIAIITVFIAELMQSTSTSFQVAVSERDRLRAEYLAKSGINLTRLLIAREPAIRSVVSPLYQMALHRSPPQLNVWSFADQVLAPFANMNAAKTDGTAETGIDFNQMQGLKDTGGTFEILALPENTRLNVNYPLYIPGPEGPRSLAMQLFSMMGGFQTQSPYDSMFNTIDPDGQITTRLDIVSDIIDWWDFDEQRTVFDPGQLAVTMAGGEDTIYRQYTDPYVAKNAPFDSLEELRMVRGVTDDFWATFVEPDPEDPRSRRLTVYGSGAINPNDSPPNVILSRMCSYVAEQMLCQDPLQQAAFIQLMTTGHSILPIPWFTRADDFLQFMQGRGELYTMLASILGKTPLMAWTPLTLAADKAKALSGSFVMGARIFTIQATGHVGHTSVRVSSVVNFDDHWTPPPPVAAKMSSLGIFLHYRVD